MTGAEQVRALQALTPVLPALTAAVVVCTHRLERLPMLRAALASLQGQRRAPAEVLVVVDGDDRLRDAVAAALGSDQRVLGMGANRGVSAARNAGAAAVTADVVAFLDDDATAEPDWLEVLLVALEGDPDALGASGRSVARFAGPRPGWLPEEFLWTVGCSYRGQPETSTVVRNLFGGCAAIRRRPFLDLGGYALDAGHRGDQVGGGEEAEFCLRAKRATGAHFRYEPGASIVHEVPTARLTLRYLVVRCYGEGRAKARVAGRVPGALEAERGFARGLPLVALRALVTPGQQARALGVLVGALAVLAGLSRERIALALGSFAAPRGADAR